MPWLGIRNGLSSLREWDRVCTPEFGASSAVVGRVQVLLLGEVVTATGRTGSRLVVWIVGNGWGAVSG